MTYELLISDRSYSSWSLRGWLLFAAFDIPVTVQVTRLYEPGFGDSLAAFAPARSVPAARADDGAVWTDSLAIAEGLAERHPGAGHWPAEPRARALARSMVAEMHAGFTALRSACPMNLRLKWQGFAPSDAVLDDLARLDVLFRAARDLANGGPWLFGRYSAADAFYAPVAARIAGYGLPVSATVAAQVEAQLAHPHLRAWRAKGEAADRIIDLYDLGLPTEPFPGL